MRKVFLGISASIRKTFVDIFSARSNTTGSLGTASDGSQWEAVSKVIEVQGGKAVANYVPQPTDDGSEYPIAVVNMPTQNNIITLEDTDIGSGVALWVQTSADWWMVSVDSAYNTIPGATNYTSAPSTFTGQSSYTATSAYTSDVAGYTSTMEYTLGPTIYSSLPLEYSSSGDTFTSGPTNYTSSLDNFSSTPTFTSSTPYTSGQTFTSAQVFSAFTPTFASANYTSAVTGTYQNTGAYNVSTWNRWSPYTSGTVWTATPQNLWNSALGSVYTVRYTKSGTLSGCCWTRAYSRNTTWYRQINWTSATVWSRQDYWNINTTTFNAVTGTYQNFATWAAPYSLNGPTTWTSNPQTFTAGTPTFTAGPNNYTSAQFYTSSAGTFTSAIEFFSTTPYSSSTPYSSNTEFTSAQNYFADMLYTSGLVYTLGSTYTSSTVYSSVTDPDTFSYSAILKISQSVSDVVSEISSAIVSTTQTIKSILVQTVGNQITAKAFSDVVPITQIGSDLIYDATGVIINTRYGIAISKAEYENDQIGSSVKIERGV